MWYIVLLSNNTKFSCKGLVLSDVDLRAISVKFYGHELEAESESNDYDDLPTSFSNILINLVNEWFAIAKNKVHFFSIYNIYNIKLNQQVSKKTNLQKTTNFETKLDWADKIQVCAIYTGLIVGSPLNFVVLVSINGIWYYLIYHSHRKYSYILDCNANQSNKDLKKIIPHTYSDDCRFVFRDACLTYQTFNAWRRYFKIIFNLKIIQSNYKWTTE